MSGAPIPSLTLSSGPAVSGATTNHTVNAGWNSGPWNPFQQQQSTLFGMNPLMLIALAGAGFFVWKKL